MDNQKRGLDIDKAEAAMKRAAAKAMNGTREERSGRFVLKEEIPISQKHLQTSASRSATGSKEP